MIFNIIKNRERLQELRQEIVTDLQRNLHFEGRVISTISNAPPAYFHRLSGMLIESEHRKQFFGMDYYIASKDGHLKEIIPVPEYFKDSFSAISEKMFALNRNIEIIKSTLDKLEEKYKSNKKTRSETGQTYFHSENEIIEIKSELSAYLFTSRAILDSLATLLHFLYGPTAGQFTSFSKFMKTALQEKIDPKNPIQNDSAMKTYLSANLDWFWKLRDYRDYITHVGSIKISFYEMSGSVKIVLNRAFDFFDFINETSTGLIRLLEFFDTHFAARIT